MGHESEEETSGSEGVDSGERLQDEGSIDDQRGRDAWIDTCWRAIEIACNRWKSVTYPIAKTALKTRASTAARNEERTSK